MRCEKCGADIGERRVCPFCATPTKNVLVGDGSTDKESIKFIDVGDAGQTSVMTSGHFDSEATGVMIGNMGFQSAVSETEREEKKTEKKQKKQKKKKTPQNKSEAINGVKEEQNFQSVIPDFETETKKPKEKKKKIFISIIVGILIFSLILGVVIYICIKKYKKYVNQLLNVSVELYDENEIITYKEFEWKEKETNGERKLIISNLKTEENIEIMVPQYAMFAVSTYGRYGAYQTQGSYEVWVDDHTEEGKHKETIYTYQLYLVTKHGENIKLFDTEKKHGEIKLLGVTDNGGIVYTDTEAGVSYCVTQQESIGFDAEITTMLAYLDGVYVIVYSDKQLKLKNIGQSENVLSDFVISSAVEKLYFQDAKCKYGLLEEAEGVTSTESVSKTIAYRSNGKTYKLDMQGSVSESTPVLADNLLTDQKTYMSINLDIIDLTKINLNGKGTLYIDKKNRLCYKQGIYDRKLDLCDEIVGLVGTKAFYMYDNKMYEVDVFSKKSKEVSNHRKKIIIR